MGPADACLTDRALKEGSQQDSIKECGVVFDIFLVS